MTLDQTRELLERLGMVVHEARRGSGRSRAVTW